MSSGAHNHALESVKMQLLQVESQLASVRKEHMKEKTLLMERENVLQEEKLQLSSSLAIAERQVAAERGKVRDYQATMQNLKKELQLLKNEHVDYKQRAAGILQVVPLISEIVLHVTISSSPLHLFLFHTFFPPPSLLWFSSPSFPLVSYLLPPCPIFFSG